MPFRELRIQSDLTGLVYNVQYAVEEDTLKLRIVAPGKVFTGQEAYKILLGLLDSVGVSAKIVGLASSLQDLGDECTVYRWDWSELPFIAYTEKRKSLLLLTAREYYTIFYNVLARPKIKGDVQRRSMNHPVPLIYELVAEGRRESNFRHILYLLEGGGVFYASYYGDICYGRSEHVEPGSLLKFAVNKRNRVREKLVNRTPQPVPTSVFDAPYIYALRDIAGEFTEEDVRKRYKYEGIYMVLEVEEESRKVEIKRLGFLIPHKGEVKSAKLLYLRDAVREYFARYELMAELPPIG